MAFIGEIISGSAGSDGNAHILLSGSLEVTRGGEDGGEIRMRELDANGIHYVGFSSPDALAANTIYEMPAAFPGSNKILQSTSAGVLTWETAGSLSGLGSTNNALLRADGTGGSTAQGSSILVDDSDNMSAVGTLATTGAVTIAAAGGLAGLGAGGDEFSITESSDDVTLATLINDKDMIFKVNDNTTATEVFRLDGSESSLLMASGKELQFADTGEHISGDGSTLSIVSEAGSIAIGAALADGQTLKLGKNGAVETIIAPHGTPGNELYSVINTAGTTDGSDAAGSILLSAVAGGIGLAWADDKDLWAEGGQIVITANHNTSEAIKIHADAGASQTIQIINDEGTAEGAEGSGAIDIEATVGGISLHAADDKDIAIEAGQVVITANHNASESIKLHADAGANQTIQIINDAGTADGAEGSGAIDIEATVGGISLHAADDKDIAIEAGQLVLTANHDAASSIKLHADAGTSQSIYVVNDAGTAAAAATESDAAIQLHSAAGGIGLLSALNNVNAIRIEADGGDDETIVIHSNQGTGDDSIQLISDEGGITVNLASGKAVIPATTNVNDLGTANKVWRNIYTGDLHLANDRGNWTIVEEADMLTIRNNKNGKWYQMNMTEIDPTGRDEGMAPTS